jgi:hypothetical protein
MVNNTIAIASVVRSPARKKGQQRDHHRSKKKASYEPFVVVVVDI